MTENAGVPVKKCRSPVEEECDGGSGGFVK